MVTIPFRNLGGNPATLPRLRRLAGRLDVDIFLLAEAPDDLGPALAGLNEAGIGRYREAGVVRPKVRCLTWLPEWDFAPRFTWPDRGMTVWALKAPKLAPTEVSLAVVHLPSKMGGETDATLAVNASLVAADLARYEDERCKHRNTVVVGDFNMNPFDPGMTMVRGFQAVTTRHLAERKRVRKQGGKSYHGFYNPMWGLFGDRTPGPAGSHFWRKSRTGNPWSMLDQVLVRKGVIDHLKGLEILAHDGVQSLTAADKAPSKDHLSNHLPILFSLDI